MRTTATMTGGGGWAALPPGTEDRHYLRTWRYIFISPGDLLKFEIRHYKRARDVR